MDEKKPPNSHGRDKTIPVQRKLPKLPPNDNGHPSLLRRRLMEAQTTYFPSSPCPSLLYRGYSSMSPRISPQYTTPPMCSNTPAYSTTPVYSLPRSVGYLTASYDTQYGRSPCEIRSPPYVPYWREKEQLGRIKQPLANCDDLIRKTLDTVRRRDGKSQRFDIPRCETFETDQRSNILGTSERLESSGASEVIDFNEIKRVKAIKLRRQEYIRHYSSYEEGNDQWMPLDITNRNRLVSGKFESVILNKLREENIPPPIEENSREENIRTHFEHDRVASVCAKYVCKGTKISNEDNAYETIVSSKGVVTDQIEKQLQARNEHKSDEQNKNAAIKENLDGKVKSGTFNYNALGLKKDPCEFVSQYPRIYSKKENEVKTGINNVNNEINDEDILSDSRKNMADIDQNISQNQPLLHEYSPKNEAIAHENFDENSTESKTLKLNSENYSSEVKTSNSRVYLENTLQEELSNALHSNTATEHDIDKVKTKSRLKIDGRSSSSQVNTPESKIFLKNIVDKTLNDALQKNSTTSSSVYLQNTANEKLNSALQSKNVVSNREIKYNNELESPDHQSQSPQPLKTEEVNNKTESTAADTERKEIKAKSGSKMFENKGMDADIQNDQDRDSHESEWMKELVDNETSRALPEEENKTVSTTETLETTRVLSKYIMNTHEVVKSEAKPTDVPHLKNITTNIETSLGSIALSITASDLTLENTKSLSQFDYSTSQNIYQMSCPDMLPSPKKSYQTRSQSMPYFTYSDLDALDPSFWEEKFSDRIRTTLAFPSDSQSYNRIVCARESLSSDAISLYMKNLDHSSNYTKSTLFRLSPVNSNILGDIDSGVIRNRVDASTEMFAQDLDVFFKCKYHTYESK